MACWPTGRTPVAGTGPGGPADRPETSCPARAAAVPDALQVAVGCGAAAHAPRTRACLAVKRAAWRGRAGRHRGRAGVPAHESAGRGHRRHRNRAPRWAAPAHRGLLPDGEGGLPGRAADVPYGGPAAAADHEQLRDRVASEGEDAAGSAKAWLRSGTAAHGLRTELLGCLRPAVSAARTRPAGAAGAVGDPSWGALGTASTIPNRAANSLGTATPR